MNIKIQNSGKNGDTNTKGSSRALAEYCEHEDEERRKQGKKVFPFTKADGTPVSTEEVIDKIDRNGVSLHKGEDRHFHIIVSPSANEIRHLGNDEQELYEKSKVLMKYLLDSYAEGFHNDAVVDSSDLEVYWKPHFTRGENGEEQYHIHLIVSRRAKGKGAKISPMTNHKNTQTGPVKGGFDRKAFFERGEKLFDQLFEYERKVEETFAYQNAMAHGTAEEKAQQAERLARENEETLRAEIKVAFEKRRHQKIMQREVSELDQILGQKEFPHKESNLVNALKIAGTFNDIMRIFTISQDEPSCKLNLFAIGVTCRPVIAADGGIEDFTFSLKGQRFKASETLSSGQFDDLLTHWERMTGKESTYKIQKRKAAKEAEQRTKKLTEERRYGRGFGLKIR